MAARIHVFAGPSLSGRDVRTLLPDAVQHPPVAAGDLLTLPAAPGDVVVLVDGVAAGGRAVRHKEILAMLDAGVEVWGAGTMGALRAAELHRQGMRPFGRVARLLIRGVLDADDEVVLDHLGAEARFAPRSLPLVDVRALVRWAHRRGVIDRDSAQRVVAAARNLPFTRRRWEEILGRAVDAGLDAEMAWRVEQLSGSPAAPRPTRADALGCLEAVRRRRGAPPRPRPGTDARPTTTAYAHAWREQRTGRREHGAGFVADVDVLSFCRLLGVDYPALQHHVALHTLAALTVPEPRPGEREGQAMIREFAEEQRLVPGTIALWLAERGLSRPDLLAHLRREAAVRALLDGLRINPRNQPAAELALSAAVADYARRRGLFAARPGRSWERVWLTPGELETLGPDQRVARLAARSFRCAPGIDWRGPLLQELKVRGAFRVAREGVAEAQERFGDAVLPPEEVLAWAAQRWEVRDRFDLALRDRGLSREELLAVAPRSVALDRAVSTYRDLHCLGQRTAAPA